MLMMHIAAPVEPRRWANKCRGPKNERNPYLRNELESRLADVYSEKRGFGQIPGELQIRSTGQ